MDIAAARLAAHERAMRVDPDYRAVFERLERERRLVENLTIDQHGKRRRSTRRLWSSDELPMPRAFFRGPKWKRLCDVREVPIAAIDPVAAQYHRPGRKLLVFTFEEEVRERILVQLSQTTAAQWSDPLEQLGVR